MAGKVKAPAKRVANAKPVAKRKTVTPAVESFPSDGERVARFMEAYVVQTKGAYAGQGLALQPWQRDFVEELYRLGPDGKRVWHTAMLLLPRKNGKSTLAAALALYHLVGDGEMSPEVILAANSRDQAGAVWRQMRDTVLSSPKLADWVKPMRTHLECSSNMGVARTISSESRTAHGSSPSFATVDELWGAKSMDLLEAIVSGVGARSEPLTCIISTVGHDREKSPLGQMHRALYELPEDAREVRNDGFLTIGRDFESRTLYWCYGPPMTADGRYDCDLADPEVWAACNPASWISAEYLKEQYHAPSMRPAEFQRFMLNCWSTAEDYWLPQGAWDRCRDGFVPIEDGAKVTLGVDLGLKRDRSSVVVCRRREVDGEHHFDAVAHVWNPPADENLTFDINEIRRFIQQCAEKYNIERIALDPWRLEETGEYLYDQLQLEVVRYDMGWARTGPATEQLYDAICSARVHHDGDPVFAAHVAGGATTTNERGNFRLTKRKTTTPIDALIALMMAHDESRKAGSIYDDREMIVL